MNSQKKNSILIAKLLKKYEDFYMLGELGLLETSIIRNAM